MTDTTEPDNVVPLFQGEDKDWVNITYIKDDGVLCAPDDVLTHQIGQLKHVVLIGISQNDGFVLASSMSRLADINYLVDSIKNKMTAIDLE